MSGRPRRSAAAEAAPRRRGRGAPSRGRHAAPRRDTAVRVARRLLLPLVLAAITVAVLVLGVFPTRTWLDQRNAVNAAQTRLAELEEANSARQAEVDALHTDARIEQIAREEYGYAKVGEEVYHVLPEAQDPVPVPDAWPFTRVGPRLEGRTPSAD